MRTILFLFSTESSLKKHQNLVRDILYYGYDIHIETCSQELLNLDSVLGFNKYLMVFTEDHHPAKNKKFRKLFDGINATDIIEEINQECLVFN